MLRGSTILFSVSLLLSAACSAEIPGRDHGSPDGGASDGTTGGPGGGSGDGGGGGDVDAAPADPTPDAGPAAEAWTPRPWNATRFVVFYEMTADVLPVYADETSGLPHAAGHGYIFSESHASVYASKTLADKIHAARDDFYYAPAFDLHEFPGWGTASDAQILTWTHGFRDAALAAHADFFTFNEAPSTTPTSDSARIQMAKIVRGLNDPDDAGVRLRGVFFLTEAAATPSNWTSTAPLFWRAVNQTSIAVVAEHYHGQGFVCSNSESFLAAHLFALRTWLEASRDPDKLEIANAKFTVLHSARYAPGTSGWAGADSTQTSLAGFQRAMSRLARITRMTPGGVNRISFGPVANNITDPRVHPRIALLARWHYGDEAAQASETTCIAGAAVNCECQ